MTLNEKFDAEVVNLLIEIEKKGFRLCLIGGAVRDFFLDTNNSFGLDLDFELRTSIENVNWEDELKKLVHFLEASNLKIEKLPYQILRVHFKKFILEFSTPRREKQILGENGHHHFEAELSPLLNYEKAFLRRDFTINAIGLESDFKHNVFSVIDPFKGINDLKNKLLRPVSDQFYFDYVRFLRLIRFYSLGYDYDSTIDFSKFKLDKITDHYFCSEFNKSNKCIFLDKMIEISMHGHFPELSFLSELNFHFKNYQIENEIDVLVVSLINKKNPIELFNKLKIKEKDFLKFKKYFQALEICKNINAIEIKRLLDMELDQYSQDDFFVQIKYLVENKNLQGYFSKFNCKFKFDLELYQTVEINSVELHSIAPELRSIYKLKKLLEIWNKNG